MTSFRAVAALAILGGAALTGCATRKDVQEIQADVALFKAEVGRRDSVRAAQLGEVIRMQQALFDSVLATGQAVNRLKGDLAPDLYNIQQQLFQLQELTGQSQRRLSELRVQLEAQASQLQVAAPPPGDSGGPAPAGGASAAQMFSVSIEQLKRGNASTARLGLQQLVQTHPTSERAPDALYFIGQSYVVENPDSMAAYYQRVVNQYPASLHASAALWGLGGLAELRKDATKAKQIYQQVIERYPNSAEADLAREKLKTPRRP